MTLKTENALFLMARHYFYLQDIKISFGHVDFYAKMLLVLGARVRNSPTQQTILATYRIGTTGIYATLAVGHASSPPILPNVTQSYKKIAKISEKSDKN